MALLSLNARPLSTYLNEYLEHLEAAEEERIDLAEVQKILEDPTEERIPWEQIKAERQRGGVG